MQQTHEMPDMISVGSRGANPAMAPHQSWKWSNDRPNNDNTKIINEENILDSCIVNLSKCKEIVPPRIDVGYEFAPRYGKMPR